MKKILFLMLLCIGFVSCSNDDNDTGLNDPISNLEIPQSSVDNPIKSGEGVTIKGAGFTQASEIWLRVLTRNAESDVKVEITSVTASDISFIAPAVSGERNVILKQSGQEYSLGKMYFEDSSGSIVKKRLVKSSYHGDIEEFSYNADGRLDKMKEYTIWQGVTHGYEISFKYNNEGLLIQAIERDVVSKEIKEDISFKYVDKTTIEVTENLVEDGNVIYSTLTLNESGQLINKKYVDGTIDYEYDSNGNISKILDVSDVETTTHTYKYDDKKSYLSNMGLPIWFWNYVLFGYYHDGPNNVVESNFVSDDYIQLFKYDYDEDGYPTAIYDVNSENQKIGDFTYEVIK